MEKCNIEQSNFFYLRRPSFVLCFNLVIYKEKYKYFQEFQRNYVSILVMSNVHCVHYWWFWIYWLFIYISSCQGTNKLFDAWVLVSNETVQCCLNCKFTTLGPICICLLNADLLCFNMYILLSCMTRGRHPLSLTSNTCLIAIV